MAHHDTAFRLLAELTGLSGVSGQEEPLRTVLRGHLASRVDQVRTDALGNLRGIKHGQPAGPRILLAAHMDEIGLVVTQIEGGFLRFTRVGGADLRVLPAQEVTVHTAQGDLPGVIASRPPHVLGPEERRHPFRQDQLFIDLGLEEAQVRERVQVGDFVSLRQETVRLGQAFATGKAVDNRASLVVLLRTLDHLQTMAHAWEVVALATVQEEITLGGAYTGTYRVRPHVGIALDVTFARQPGVSDEEAVAWDRGPAIALGPNIHPRVRERLVETAQRHEIPYVEEVLPGHSGTDAWAIQVTRSGVPTGLLSLPIRNMHTPGETVCLRDMERTARLLAHFIAELEPDWTP